MTIKHQARKRFGQNFLVDQQIISQIVSAVGPKPDDNLNNGLFHANGHSDGQEHQQQMATENNLNNHNVHQEEKEDNLHDLDQGNLLRSIDNCSGAA